MQRLRDIPLETTVHEIETGLAHVVQFGRNDALVNELHHACSQVTLEVHMASPEVGARVRTVVSQCRETLAAMGMSGRRAS